MRKFKYIIPVSLIALVLAFSFTSCEQREDWRVPELGNGGFLKFTQQPFQWEGSDNAGGTSIVKYHIGEDPLASSFTAFVEDPNGNVASVDYFVTGSFENAPEEPIIWRSSTSFPFDVSFTTQDMADLFGVSPEVFQTGDFFEFTTVITTDDGRVYISRASECEPCPVETGTDEGAGGWNGGTIDEVLLLGGDTGDNALLPAVWYRVKYLAPSE